MPDMTNSTLKPCPFCGQPPDPSCKGNYIRCVNPDCGLGIPGVWLDEQEAHRA